MAAGALLPLTGTMLTPSIAGALMGVSSLGVMGNSLLLQLEVRGTKRSKDFAVKQMRMDLSQERSQPDIEKGVGWQTKFRN